MARCHVKHAGTQARWHVKHTDTQERWHVDHDGTLFSKLGTEPFHKTSILLFRVTYTQVKK